MAEFNTVDFSSSVDTTGGNSNYSSVDDRYNDTGNGNGWIDTIVGNLGSVLDGSSKLVYAFKGIPATTVNNGTNNGGSPASSNNNMLFAFIGLLVLLVVIVLLARR